VKQAVFDFIDDEAGRDERAATLLDRTTDNRQRAEDGA
jgi:hypothetical protein